MPTARDIKIDGVMIKQARLDAAEGETVTVTNPETGETVTIILNGVSPEQKQFFMNTSIHITIVTQQDEPLILHGH